MFVLLKFTLGLVMCISAFAQPALIHDTSTASTTLPPAPSLSSKYCSKVDLNQFSDARFEWIREKFPLSLDGKRSMLLNPVEISIQNQPFYPNLENVGRALIENLGLTKKIRNDLYIAESKPASDIGDQISQAKHNLEKVRLRLNDLLNTVPRSFLYELGPYYSLYFQSAYNLIHAELYLNPYMITSTTHFDKIYFAGFTPFQFDKVFPSINQVLDGLIFKRISLAHGRSLIYLTIQPRQIVVALQRAAALSPSFSSTPSVAYRVTAQCILGHEMINRFVVNQLLADNFSPKLNLPVSTPICLGLSSKDLVNTEIEAQTYLNYNNDMRVGLGELLPSYYRRLNEEDMKLFTVTVRDSTKKIGEGVIDLAEYLTYGSILPPPPEDTGVQTPLALSFLDGSKAGDLARKEKLNSLIDDLHPSLPEPLTEFFKDQGLLGEMSRMYQECGFEAPNNTKSNGDASGPVPPKDANLVVSHSFEEFSNELIKLEYMYSYMKFDEALNRNILLFGANEAEQKQELLNIILNAKIEGMMAALTMALRHRFSDNAPLDVSPILTNLRVNAVEPYAEKLLLNLKTSPIVQGWIQNKVQALNATVRLGSVQKTKSILFRGALIQDSIKINELMSAEVNSETFNKIKYSRGAISNYYRQKLAGVSSQTLEQMVPLFDAKSTAEARGIAEMIYSRLGNERLFDKQGVEAFARPLSITEYVTEPSAAIDSIKSKWRTLWGSKPDAIVSERTQQLQGDRAILDEMMNRMGLNGSTRERKTIVDALADQNQLNAPEQADFIKKYKEYLFLEYQAKYGIIDMPVKSWTLGNKQEVTIPLYKAIAQNFDTDGYTESLIANAIQQVVQNLEKQIAALANVHSEEGLKPFVINSSLLNDLMGVKSLTDAFLVRDLSKPFELDMDSLQSESRIFSTIAATHVKLRAKWIQDKTYYERLQHKGMDATLFAINGLLGGYVLRYAFRAMPQFLAGPITASTLFTGSKHIKNLTHAYWNLVFLSIGESLAYHTWHFGDTYLDSHGANNVFFKRLGLDDFRFTDSAEVSLVSAKDYKSRKDELDSQLNNDLLQIGANTLWLSLGYSPEILSKLFKWIPRKVTVVFEANIQKISKRHNRKLNKAYTQGSQANLHKAMFEEALYAERRFEKIGNMLRHEFNALGLKKPTFNIYELKRALNETLSTAGQTGKIRADMAYERIVMEMEKGVRSFYDQPYMLEIFARQIFGGKEAFNEFINTVNNLVRTQKGAFR